MKKFLVISLLFGLSLSLFACARSFDLEKANPNTVSILTGQEIAPMALRDDMEFYLDMIFGLLPTLQDSGNGLLGEVMNVFNLILSGGGGTCPVVTVSPPISGLTLPSTITVTADYGAGCVAADGSTMSGFWKMTVSDIIQTLTGISADFSFTMSHLTQNGMLLSNGTISGYVELASAGSDQQVTVFVTTRGLQISEFATLSGSITVVAVGQVGLDGASFDTVTVTPDDLTLAYNVLLLSGEYAIYSGTVVSDRQGSTENFEITANLRTSAGTIKGTAYLESPTGGYYSISTAAPYFVVNGDYYITVDDVVLEPAVCIYPRSGTIYVTHGADHVGISFPGTCDGTYDFF